MAVSGRPLRGVRFPRDVMLVPSLRRRRRLSEIKGASFERRERESRTRRSRLGFDVVGLTGLLLVGTVTLGSPASAAGGQGYVGSSGVMSCGGGFYNWATQRSTAAANGSIDLSFVDINGDDKWLWCQGTTSSSPVYAEFIPRSCSNNTWVGWGLILASGWDGVISKSSACWRYTARRVYNSTSGTVVWQGYHAW